MPRPARLPEGWRSPTPGTLDQHKYGIEQGLVPAGADVLSSPAEAVPQDEVTGRQAQDILRHMYRVILAMQAVGRPIVGLAAPQIGESSQIVLVPRQPENEDETYGAFMPVFNPDIRIDESSPRVEVPQGCYSSNEVFCRLLSATALTLTGQDVHGEPLRMRGAEVYGLTRTGYSAAVDEHEFRHLQGIRAADVALRGGQQLDWRPPELAQEYRDLNAARREDPSLPEWDKPYPPEQWLAVKAGEFALESYYGR